MHKKQIKGKRMFKILSKLMVVISFCVIGTYAGLKENSVISTSMDIIQNVQAKIPQKLLQNANAIVIIPNLKHGGLLLGGSYGHGILTVKNENGWSDPSFVTFRSVSFGLQAGIRSTDVIMIFENKRGLNGIIDGKAIIGINAGAVVGNKERQVSKETDGELSAKIFSFGQGNGLELNIGSISGGNLYIDDETNDKYYNKIVKTDLLLSGAEQSNKPQVVEFKKVITDIIQ